MFVLFASSQPSSSSFWGWLKCFISSDTFRNLIAAVTLILAVIAGFRALAQWKESKRIKRAEYIKELTDKIRTDDDIVEIMGLIEYDRFNYNLEFHHSELEKQVDKTLSFFSYICYLKKQKILSPDEFRFFDYEVTRIFQNMDMVNYLYNLYHFSQNQNRPISFCYLVEYGLNTGLLDKDFIVCETINTHGVPKYRKIINI